ncbi:glycosyltransferase family 4 protein [Marinobacter sp. M216]|uniref:Glycosyltransferase family 4 protein n=1 Tax=Marinobacter albus TaxID=3030833 RepID=A0ABT7HBM8_9GAMM|nr:glycosyltransferase family 4 protein [Marinobacter sp. M216]MDK9557285.1 glycosyltransferase family 4 protein [Marinobacter sp. M216]
MGCKKVVILHLAHWHQLQGGAELQLKYFSEFLISRGYHVHFIYLDRTEKTVHGGNLTLHPIKFFHCSGRFGKYWFLYKWKLSKILDDIDPDFLISRTRSSWSGIAARYASKNQKRHIHYVASDNDVVFKKPGCYRVFDSIESVFYKRTFEGASKVICQNHFQKEALSKRFKIDPTIQTQAAPFPESSVQEKSSDVIRVVWIANMKQLKRPELFLSLAKRFEGRENLHFTMVGGDQEGKYQRELNGRKTQKNFTYIGKADNQEVNRLLAQSHILVNTSDYEGFSNTFVQAWMRGVYVVSLNSDPSGLMKRNRLGEKTRTFDRLCEVIEDLSSKPAALADRSYDIAKYALENHSVEAVYSRSFQEIVDG